MVLEFFVDTGYSVVEHSWMISTILVKYLLVGEVLSVFASTEHENISFDNFREVLLAYAVPSVFFFVFLGGIAYFIGFSSDPVLLPVFSEFLAWVYFGYLFWEF